MACVNTVSFAFSINGEKMGFVKPQREIRQGDPLSPYLFLICAEGFSRLLNKSVSAGKLSSVRISRKGPSSYHLFFADDTLTFCKADQQEAEELREDIRHIRKGLWAADQSGKVLSHVQQKCDSSTKAGSRKSSRSSQTGITREVSWASYGHQ